MTNYANGEGLTPLIIFRKGSERTIEICYSHAKNFTDQNDDVYDFFAQNGDTNAANYLNKNGTYSHSPSQPASSRVVASDPLGFSKALRAEPTMTPEIRTGLSWLLRMSTLGSTDHAALQQDWQDSVAIYGHSWLTSAVQETILSYAQNYNIALVPRT